MLARADEVASSLGQFAGPASLGLWSSTSAGRPRRRSLYRPLWSGSPAQLRSERRVKEFDEMLEKEKSVREAAEKMAAAQLEEERKRSQTEREAREAERKKQKEQRDKKTNYGAPQRSFLPNDEKRNDDRPAANPDRFDNPITRPQPLYPQPWPPPSWGQQQPPAEPPSKEKSSRPERRTVSVALVDR